MSRFLCLSFLLAISGVVPPSAAQESTAEKVESGAREILSDPRLEALIGSANKDREKMVAEIADDPEAAVREATRVFRENREMVDTPENREKARALSKGALSRASELNRKRTTETGPPPEEKKVPATRPTATTSEVATPVAMPVEGGDNPIAGTTGATPVVQNSEVTPLSNTGPTEARIPNSPHLTNTEPPAPKPLAPKYDLNREKAIGPGTTNPSNPDADYMEINARESIMDSKKGVLTFLGNVLVDHPDYDLKCEKLEIQLTRGVGVTNESDGAPAIKRAIASGGMVEIKRVGDGGAVQVALARKADYDAIKQEFVLSGGPPYIQDGKQFIKTTSQDSQIIMRGNGKYDIIGSGAGDGGRQIFRIQVPKSEGKDIGIGGGIGGGIEQLQN